MPLGGAYCSLYCLSLNFEFLNFRGSASSGRPPTASWVRPTDSSGPIRPNGQPTPATAKTKTKEESFWADKPLASMTTICQWFKSTKTIVKTSVSTLMIDRMLRKKRMMSWQSLETLKVTQSIEGWAEVRKGLLLLECFTNRFTNNFKCL